VQQSNGYIILFTVGLTIVVGGLLAGASQFLGPAQQRSIDLDTKSSILNAVRNQVKINEGDDILAIYDKRIKSLVVDFEGNEITTDEKGNPLVAEKVNILKNYKFDPKDRQYPVFKLMNAEDSAKVEAYILPVYGAGLWDKIWGYVAIDAKLETIVGVSFDHKAETPGLGQRIATPEIQDRYEGKKIYNESGELVSVQMMKGEHGGGGSSIEYYEGKPHQVDGMSGATLTGNGLNQMLKAYLDSYQNYFEKVESDAATASIK
jgi:Na+-transporting NADH:ubiquinone oxidoreductase subunit C